MSHRQIGDVYELSLSGDTCMYMQFVALDRTLPGSAIVRVFSARHSRSSPPDLDAVCSGEVAFHAHVFLKAGETLATWRKYGKAHVATAPSSLLWFVPPIDKLREADCAEWEVWRTNEPKETVASTDSKLDSGEFGMVMSPLLVKERAATGKWTFPCPRRVANDA